MNIKVQDIISEISKVIIGKEEVIKKILAGILSEGHILLEDVPGVGKTSLALAISKVFSLHFKRMQFTPDVLPSDIVGFNMYDMKSQEFKFVEGSINCNFFLGDEINRTSSKTQSALLEAMQEGKVTVDGVSRELEKPFVVMATQNPVDSFGTQNLPEAQLDRFIIRLSLGYPSILDEIKILSDRQDVEPLDSIKNIASKQELMNMIKEAKEVYIDEKILDYIVRLCSKTRDNSLLSLGLSPRATMAVMKMARSMAYIEGKKFVEPSLVDEIFLDVARHRVIPSPRARMEGMEAEDILKSIMDKIEASSVDEN